MKSNALRSFSLLAALMIGLVSSTAFAQQNKKKVSQANTTFENFVNRDLLQIQRNDVGGRTDAEIQSQNQKMFDLLKTYQISPSQNRVSTITEDQANVMLDSINQHPVVSEYYINNYKNGMSIGFCFGRASYVHLVSLRIGIDKESILKIWAVGPMRSGGINWQFHVATIVKADNGHWYVVDSFVGRVMTPEEWFKQMQGMASDNTLRFYVTNARKFSVSLGEYDRIQLGSDLPDWQDWYSGYFQKLMFWMGHSPVSDVGLYDFRTKK